MKSASGRRPWWVYIFGQPCGTPPCYLVSAVPVLLAPVRRVLYLLLGFNSEHVLYLAQFIAHAHTLSDYCRIFRTR